MSSLTVSYAMKRRGENYACSSNKRQIMTSKDLYDEDLPQSVNYWMTSESKHDCFFNVGPESGPIERIGAVKILLMGHSEVLQRMLDESALAETGDIRIVDSDPETFNNWLKCVYGGTDILLRKLPFENSLKLLYLCEKYLLLELKDKICDCIMQLHQPLSVDKAVIALSYLTCLNMSLSAAISRVIKDDTDSFLNHESFLDLNTNAVAFIAKQKEISSKEIKMWKAVVKWAQSKISSPRHSEERIISSDGSDMDEEGESRSEDLRSCLKSIINHIRFCTMTRKEFDKYVIPSGILTLEEIVEIWDSMKTKNELKGVLSASIVSRYHYSDPYKPWKNLIPIAKAPLPCGLFSPYNIQRAFLYGKTIDCFNKTPFIYVDLVITIPDMISYFFPTVAPDECRKVVQDVLKINVYKGNRQLMRVLKKYGKCKSVSDTLPLIEVRDVIKHMSQLKYVMGRAAGLRVG